MTTAEAFAAVLPFARTEDDVHRLMHLACLASVKENWPVSVCATVTQAGRDRIDELALAA